MQFKAFIFTGLLTALVNGAIYTSGTIVHEQNGIVSPSSGSEAPAGQSINFKYLNSDACHAGFSAISVYLLASPPAVSDVTSSGTFANFLYFFGVFTIPNFDNLPPIGTPPPPTLTVPNLGPAVPSGQLVFSVIENITNCPPDEHVEFGLSFVPIEYLADM